MQAISSRNEHRKMQDSLSFTFYWGETFDTAPYRTQSRLVSSHSASLHGAVTDAVVLANSQQKAPPTTACRLRWGEYLLVALGYRLVAIAFWQFLLYIIGVRRDHT